MNNKKQFDQLEASLLYCPRCQRAMPVRKRLLLVLPTGDKYEYVCSQCGHSVGEKTDSASEAFNGLIWPPKL